MSDDLSTGLAATANEPSADSTPTQDSVLDAAFASSDGPAPSEPSESAEPAPEPAAAIAQPQEQSKAETQPKGEPPREKWDSILANARTKARDEALAEHRDALEIVHKLRSDFSGTLAQLLEEAAGDERFSEAITAKAAALLNARKQRSRQDEEPQPDAVMRYEDGTTEPSFSPGQLRKWQEWNSRQLEKRIGDQFKPLQELTQQFERAKEHAAISKAADEQAGKLASLWKSMPMFAEHQAAIVKRQAEIYGELIASGRTDGDGSVGEALQRAYAEVITSQALPKLQAQQTATMVANAAHKRAGSSTDPAAAAPAQPRRPRTPDEALDQVFGAYAGA